MSSGLIGTIDTKSKVLRRSKDIAKAWARFSQSGSHPIDASFNVSSVSDEGSGTSRCNFVVPMPDTNYVAVSGNNDWNAYTSEDGQTTTYWEIRCARADSNTLGDVSKVSGLVFGD